MSTDAVLTLVVVVGVLALMVASTVPPDLLLLGGVVVLLLAGVLEPSDALAGFANPGVIAIGGLFVVAAGLRETGAVTLVTGRLLGRPATVRGALLRLLPPVALASAFLNNTTVVAALMPAVGDWSRRIGQSPGRLLMPLSFATILGGTCTLVGTSTNLVVSGMVVDLAAGRDDLHALGMFEITGVGLGVCAVGLLLLLTAGPRLLPERRAPVGRHGDPREYSMELFLPPGSRLAGRSVEEAGLRHLPGAFLMDIVRDGELLPMVDSEQRLHAGDHLVFVGDVDAMVDLQRTPGLQAAPRQVFQLQGDRLERSIVEAVVSPRNPLVGSTIRDGGFRARYHAVVIAVARAGERLRGRIGDIVLHPGDVLLLEASRDFVQAERSRTDFVLVSTVDGASPPRTGKALLSGLILLALVGSVALGLLSTETAALAAAGATVLARCCSVEQARRALDLSLLIAIASALGLGRALQLTGLDQQGADLVLSLGVTEPLLALALVYVATTLLTEVVTNNAAAALALPLAISLADRVGAAPMAFVVAVLFAASASFLTPLGYQTNLMVFNAGGYRPLDYLRLGLPLSVAVAATTVGLIPVFFPF